jgi:hypothetical protein
MRFLDDALRGPRSGQNARGVGCSELDDRAYMSSPDAVTVNFELTRAEYLHAHLLAMSCQPMALILPPLGVALIVVGVFAGPEYAGAGIGALLCLFLPWWRARQRWQRDPVQAVPFTYQFDTAGIAITSPAGNVALPWTRVRTVTIGERLVVLNMISAGGVMFPWRAVATADQERLKSMLQECPARQRPRGGAATT